MKKTSPLAIFAGVAVSQAVAFIFATILIIAMFFIYKNKVLVAYFEYPGPIALTGLAHLLSVAVGGYVAMQVSNKSLINPLLVGVVNLALSFGILYFTDIPYATDYLWMLVLSALLTLPAALVFAYFKLDKPTDKLENSLQLIAATPAHLALLRHWDEQPHVIASDPNDDCEWELELARNPSWREQLVATVNDTPIGFVQIIDPAEEESHYWGDVPANLRAIDIWIGEADYLGRGFGTRIMHMAIDRCFATPEVEAVIIDPLASNTRAHRFYERLGFIATGPRQFGEDECIVYRLDRRQWKPEHIPPGR